MDVIPLPPLADGGVGDAVLASQFAVAVADAGRRRLDLDANLGVGGLFMQFDGHLLASG